MLAPELVEVFTARLGRAGVPYFVTGSVASILYGEPRLTLDVDLVLELVFQQIGALRGAFPDELFYCPPLEVLETEIARDRRGHFNLIHYETGFRADVYLCGRDPLHRWAMQRRRSFAVGAEPFWVAPPEYVIVRKLEYFREGGGEKHLGDIAGMLAVSGPVVDMEELRKRVETRGLDAEWAAALAFARR